jgi:ABC-type sugar transport system, permease component
VNITFEGYEKVFQRGDIWQGYLNTIIYTVVTVILSLVVTIPAGWGLSRKTTPGKNSG